MLQTGEVTEGDFLVALKNGQQWLEFLKGYANKHERCKW